MRERERERTPHNLTSPHLCREFHEKRNVTFHPNATVTYLQQRWWTWDQEASGNVTQDDPIITLNTIPVVGEGGRVGMLMTERERIHSL